MTLAELLADLHKMAEASLTEERDRVSGPVQPWACPNWAGEVLVSMDRHITEHGTTAEHALGAALADGSGAFHRPERVRKGVHMADAIIHRIGELHLPMPELPGYEGTAHVWLHSWCKTARTSVFSAVFDPLYPPKHTEGEKRCARCFPRLDESARRTAAGLKAADTRRKRQQERLEMRYRWDAEPPVDRDDIPF